MNTILEFAFQQKKMISVMIYLLTAGGLVLFYTSPKESFPAVDSRTITVVAAYPGASPQEIETQVINKIENAIVRVEGIKSVRSFIKENVGSMRIELFDSYPKTTETVKAEIQNEIDQISDFPSEMIQKSSPVANVVDLQLSSVYKIYLSGGNDQEDLHEFADRIRDVLIDLKEVNDTTISREQAKEIWVEANPSLIDERNLNMIDLYQTIRSQNIDLPSGDADINGANYTFTTKGQYNSLDEIMQTPVSVNDYGNATRIRDFSKVRYAREDVDYIYYKDNQPALSLDIIKKPGADIISLAEKVKKIVNEYNDNPEYKRFQLVGYADQSIGVKKRLRTLIDNAFIGVFFIFIVLVLVFDATSTLLAALTLPMSFGIAFFFSASAGHSLNMITMFAFIIVVGMVIDNAILITENIYTHLVLKPAETLKQTIFEAVEDVMMPLLACVLTIIAAFMPMYLIKTMIGRFLSFIPSIIVYTLVVSFIICVFYLPVVLHGQLERKLKKDPNFRVPEKAHWIDKLAGWYEKLIPRVLEHAGKFVLSTIVGMAIILFLFMKFIPKEFFMGDLLSLTLNVEFPENFSKEKTRENMYQLEKIIGETIGSDIDNTVTKVGKWDGATSAEDEFKPNQGSFEIFLNPDKKTMKDADFLLALNKILTDNKDRYNIAKSGFNLTKGGPPAGSTVNVRIFGNNAAEIKKFLDEALELVKTIPNLTGINTSYVFGKEEVRVLFDENLAGRSGVDLSSTANTLRMAFQGVAASSSNNLYKKSMDIVVKYDENSYSLRSKNDILKMLSDFKIKNNDGNYVRLGSFASFEFQNSLSFISHYNRKPFVTLSADIKDESDKVYTSQKVNSMFDEKLKPLLEKYPNIRLGQGGARETNMELSSSVTTAFSVSLIAIFFILCVLFKSFKQSFIIISVVPLGVASVIIGLLVHYLLSFIFPIGNLYFSFSFMTVLGIIALGGVLVNNSAILISFISKLREEGLDLHTSVVKGARSRLRPILLTKLTALIGMIPFSYGIMGEEPFLQPMGIALSWGILFGSFTSLFFVPSLYYMSEKFIERIYNKLGKKAPLL